MKVIFEQTVCGIIRTTNNILHRNNVYQQSNTNFSKGVC